LIRTPGTNAAAATVLDGYEMNRQGKAGQALGISLVSGLVGGLFGLVMLGLVDRAVGARGAGFHAAGLFCLGRARLSVIASLSQGSVLKGLMAASSAA